MNNKDKEWIREMILGYISQSTPDVDFYFECPHCKHQTVAQKVILRDVSSCSCPPYYTVEFTKRDRLCLNCGKKFLYTETTYYKELTEKKEEN